MKTTQLFIVKALVLITLLLNLKLVAQEKSKDVSGYAYKNAIGLRIGETPGFSYKHIFNQGNAFEGIISAWPFTLGVTGLYEKHLQTNVPGLQWYLGGGAHFKFGSPKTRIYYGYTNETRVTYVQRQNAFASGIDGIIGVEYKFREIPLALSTDIKPYTEINDYGNIYMAIDPSIGIKFTY